MTPATLERIQSQLQPNQTWVLTSFQGNNPIATDILGLIGFLSRRICAVISQQHFACMVHNIEREHALHLQQVAQVQCYTTFEQLCQLLQPHIAGKEVLLETQSSGALPYLSRVDAGTIATLEQLGCSSIASSEHLTLELQRWSEQDLNLHLQAVQGVQAARTAGYNHLCQHLTASELEVQAVIIEHLNNQGLVFDHAPNVSFGANAANPHHQPNIDRLQLGQVVLMDIWAKVPSGPYADITWMHGYHVPDTVDQLFITLAQSRDAVLERLHTPCTGAQADMAARNVLINAGHQQHLLHRTGHSLGWGSPHGNGTHLDALEHPDHRPIVDGLAFTIEPGIYIAGELGLRTEINVLQTAGKPVVTTLKQQHLQHIAH